ncbi:hypothetical protein TNCV_3716331 [Trichonephila clavipes]|nr:hypothetical protein TNCV_3716331 [Trichonephila clavipes]
MGTSKGNKVIVSLYTELPKEAKVIVVGLTVLVAANVAAPYERISSVLQTCPFPDYESVMWLYGFEGPTNRLYGLKGRLP